MGGADLIGMLWECQIFFANFKKELWGGEPP